METLQQTTENFKLELNQYSNVDKIPEGWEITYKTVTTLKKFKIPHYKYCSGTEHTGYKNYYKPILHNIIPSAFAPILEQCIQEWQEKKTAFLKREFSDKLIAECLYSINKEAKRLRDEQEHLAFYIFGRRKRNNDDQTEEKTIEEQIEREEREYYEMNNDYNGDDDYFKDYYHYDRHYKRASSKDHDRLHDIKGKKEYLYNLKDECIWKLVDKDKSLIKGQHLFQDGIYRDYIEFGNETFHLNNTNCSTYYLIPPVDLGVIDGVIPAERKRSVPPAKAKLILEEFLKR